MKSQRTAWRTRRHLCKQLFIAVAALGALSGCSERAAENASAAAQRPRTRVVRPEVRRFADSAAVQGTVRAKSSVLVAARVPGVVDALLAREGDSVEKGAPLFRIDRVNLENALRSAENDVAVARAALEQSEASVAKADADRERVLRSVRTGGVSQSEADKAVLAAKTAAAQLAGAKAFLSKCEAGLAAAKKNLEDAEVRAPFSGKVTRKLKDAGDYAAPGVPVFAMEEDGALEIRFSLDSSRYAAVKTGETEIGGMKVSWKSPTVDAATRTFEVRTLVPDGSPLVPGMLVDSEIVFSSFDSIAVPSRAVNPMQDGKSAVFAVEDGRIVRRNVTVRAESDGWCAIDAGVLDPSASVVAEGMLLLHEGDEVEAVEAAR